MAAPATQKLNECTRGWLRHLWRKATTEDDWSSSGEPHPWWDKYSLEPMLSFPRFDLSESSYALLLMGRKTPAWREVYTRILDELVRRHTTHWAAVDWLTQIGPDPDRANYPERYRGLIPKDLWGGYDVPGWTANGVEPWGVQPDPIGSDGNLFFRGFFSLLLSIHRAVSGETTWEKPFEVTGLDGRTFPWTHSKIATYLSENWAKNPEGPHCENTKVWPYCLSAAGLGLQMTRAPTGSTITGSKTPSRPDSLSSTRAVTCAPWAFTTIRCSSGPTASRARADSRPPFTSCRRTGRWRSSSTAARCLR